MGLAAKSVCVYFSRMLASGQPGLSKDDAPARLMADMYRLFAPDVRRYAFARTQDWAAADDVTGDTFVTALCWLRSHAESPNDPRSWLIGIARHRTMDLWRTRDRERARVARCVERAFSDAQLAESTGSGTDRTGDLPEHYREVLRLHYIDGWSISDLALSQGRSTSSVESQLARARRAFRQTFEGGATDFPPAGRL
jgi:RNA polymerase sigma-70 factor, ECF subfamily